MRLTLSRVSWCLALATLASGCGGADAERPIEVCTLELGVTLTPRDTVIPVGASFSTSIVLSSCGGRRQLADSFTWRTSDTAVVRVSPNGVATASVTARAAGQAEIEVIGARYGSVGLLRVAVGSR